MNKRGIVNNLQEASTINDISYNVPRISATLDGRQVDHHYTMVKVQGKFQRILCLCVCVLIDHRSTLSYISPTIIDKCEIKKAKQNRPCLVQLATGTK